MKGSQQYFRCHVPHQRVNYYLFALITLKDVSYESSQLKPKSNKMAEKKEKFGYQGQCKRRKKFRKGRWYREVKEISHSCHRFDVDWGMLANSILRYSLLVLEYFYFQPKESGSPSSSAITKGRFRYFDKTGLLKMSQARLTKIDITLFSNSIHSIVSCGINYYGPPTHNWAQAIAEIADNLRNAIDNNLYSCGVFLDFSKAFETVNHTILLKKWNGTGYAACLSNFLQAISQIDSMQYVQMGNTVSLKQTMTCGIPQGSSLGPVLFLIYINDLPNCSNALTFRIFADDTNVFASARNLKDLEEIVNSELKKVKIWCQLISLKQTSWSLNRQRKKMT